MPANYSCSVQRCSSSQDKSDISKISTKYNCTFLVFWMVWIVNLLKCHPARFTRNAFAELRLLSRMVVLLFSLITCNKYVLLPPSFNRKDAIFTSSGHMTPSSTKKEFLWHFLRNSSIWIHLKNHLTRELKPFCHVEEVFTRLAVYITSVLLQFYLPA